jgi:putative transcription antitermination factor YqgF
MTGNILGIDYGDKHIGLALASSPLAEPLTTINKSDFPGQIGKILEKHQIQAVVIGDCPQDFLADIKKLGLPVHQVDETLTTVDATKNLFHTTQTRRQTLIHAASAAVILQSWLDSGPPNR